MKCCPVAQSGRPDKAFTPHPAMCAELPDGAALMFTRFAFVAFRQRVGEMWVNLQREQTQGIKTFWIDNRHVVGSADGLAGKVGTCAPADVQRTAFDDIHNRRQQSAFAAFFQ